jgi:hypothetical protein
LTVAVDSKRRQRALAKKAAKRKAKASGARAAFSGSSAELARLLKAPIHECLVPPGMFEKGMGNLLVSRQAGGGAVALGAFLLDVWCLGVKDAMLTACSKEQYEFQVAKLGRIAPLESADPAYAKKLVFRAVEFARSLGLEPHPDYRAAKRIFEGIDAGACDQEFTFGHEGKPYFFSGPNDTPARCRQILKALSKRLGPDEFHFTVVGSGADEFREMGL